MARQDRAAPDSGARSNLYDDITNKIIAELERNHLIGTACQTLML